MVASGAPIGTVAELVEVQPLSVRVRFSATLLTFELTLKVIAFVPLPPVIAPPVIDHAYVAPALFATDAATPVAPAQAFAGAVIGIVDGTKLMLAEAGDPLQPFAVAVTPSVTVVLLLATSKVMLFVPLPAVIVPPLIVQA